MPELSPPEAVIVAGGFGTRLLPLTARRPKHLLDVGGVPFLEHQVARLAEAGVEHIVLATSYHADMFAPVLGDGSRWGVRLDYVLEEEPLGTGGAIRNVADSLTDDPNGAVIILNGDVLSGHDLAAQLADFRAGRNGRRVDVSLHLVEVDDARAFGCVPTDEEGRVLDFVEKSENPVTNQINAGCYIFRRDIIDTIRADTVVSVERETFPGLVADAHLVVGFVDSAYWRDVGTPAALVAASRDVVLGVAPTPAVAAVDSGARIDPSATVGEAEVGGGSVVMANATIADGAEVTGSVVMTGARIEAGARVVDSVVGPGAVVGDKAELREATLGDEATIGAAVTLPVGERVDCADHRG
ncbi:NDP-sugar synthase [Nocardioides sp. JQ2195]|uniref:sugar phosphate nucleotidyltransferase n=1 Tax=Nocardioides sp. JQ2195 TaxID=2592334 RepID=UPI00143E9566|nr:NDP-sugar synthase [Nocardioides sp. JQ2195]QIX25939.1 NDP-sugar synthase [Nocardioides sp. JQ2195]